jgi:broad specificity phosphatase PhoE
MSGTETRLLLLRHGEVASHRGDVPVTEAGLEHARRSGKALGTEISAPLTVLYGGTRRTRETADAVIEGIGDRTRVDGPVDSFALRNPDMYLAGTRVNMVSSPEALAEQVPGMTTEQASANSWWTEFFTAPDRIGWWLEQEQPPGENFHQVGARLETFTRSLADPGPLQGRVVVAVTHSPLLRAVLLRGTGDDPGEPGYVTGAEVRVHSGDRLTITPYDPLTPREER